MYSARRPSPERSARQAGFSLVEALATTGLLAIAMAGMTANSIYLVHAAKGSDNSGAATALAQRKLEELRSMPLGAAGHTSGNYQDVGTLEADGTANGPFTRSWQVSLKDQPGWGLKTVSVSVAWRDSIARTTRLMAYVRCSTSPCP